MTPGSGRVGSWLWLSRFQFFHAQHCASWELFKVEMPALLESADWTTSCAFCRYHWQDSCLSLNFQFRNVGWPVHSQVATGALPVPGVSLPSLMGSRQALSASMLGLWTGSSGMVSYGNWKPPGSSLSLSGIRESKQVWPWDAGLC